MWLLIPPGIFASALPSQRSARRSPTFTTDRRPTMWFDQEQDEVSAVAVILARNGYITGQTINVNGRWYMS